MIIEAITLGFACFAFGFAVANWLSAKSNFETQLELNRRLQGPNAFCQQAIRERAQLLDDLQQQGENIKMRSKALGFPTLEEALADKRKDIL